jgi:uncharacterized Zn finger protein
VEHSDYSPGEFLPPSSTPRPVEGGIRLQSRRGGTAWWTRRWLAAIEAGAVGERLDRGLDDARRGQVLELDVTLEGVRALVQGTRRTPERVVLRLPAIEQGAWLQVAGAISTRGASRADVLAGHMPEDVEAACRRAGFELFPTLDDDLELDCTCEDWSSPCRHAIAVGALLGEVMDREPLLAFRLRGIEPDVLLALVAGQPVAPVHARNDEKGTTDEPATGQVVGPDRSTPGPLPLDVTPPRLDAPLVRILGAPRMWRGADDFEPAIRRMQARASTDPRVIDIALATPRERRSRDAR